MIGPRDLLEAQRRLDGVIRATPLDHATTFSHLAGRSVWLKHEYLQRTGSFKIRGAYNRIAQLPADTRVVAASAGNHAQGVALAAALTGRPAVIYMPRNAALPKVEATRGYGATVRLEGEVVDDCIGLARAYAAEAAATYVPPFDDPAVIAGQGTVGLEIAEQVPDDTETVVVPVGGGGLIAGIATALAHRRPSVRVVGVEAAGAASMTAALAAGKPVMLDHLNTMADGIAVRSCSALTLAHVQAYVDDVVTLDEEAITQAMLLLIERAKAVVEPSGAASLAAILTGNVHGRGPAVAVLSGGNVDPLLLTKLIDHGLSAAGRYLVIRVVTSDRPGALATLTAQLARLELNVLAVEHHRSGMSLGFSQVEILVTVETRNPEHGEEVLAALRQAGYRVETA